LNKPSPAIVPQAAVRRIPRMALLLFCLAYVLPGFFGRAPWKFEDITTFGVARELAFGGNWMSPQLLGQATGFDALVPYWIGAMAIRLLPWLDAAAAVRIPFAVLLIFTLLATWYATYCLARSPQAQPVAFAFGGEAQPTDYARAIADAGLLALIACLGLAQLSHETTPALAQLGFSTLVFYALAASPYRSGKRLAGLACWLGAGMAGLALSGAPSLALMSGVLGVLVEALQLKMKVEADASAEAREDRRRSLTWMLVIALLALGVAFLASAADVWRWRIQLPGTGDVTSTVAWRKLGRLLLWFTWPAWPLALWTLWRWRRQLSSRHVALPLGFACISIAATLTTASADRSLLLGLPALAALAAFALPTFKRSAASLIDWFTLVFFTSCAIIIWVVWVAMETGVPRQPAANVARLAPGFEPSFSWIAFLAASTASLAWAWLVRWRVGAHRPAIWKSLVLPAGGATLCWLLLMTLWLPLLDYARSYAPMARQLARLVDRQACVEIYGLRSAQAAAFQYHGGLRLQQASRLGGCPYLVVDAEDHNRLSSVVELPDWAFLATIRRPTDKNETVLLYKRIGGGAVPAGAAPARVR
jgi:hypothetical protein